MDATQRIVDRRIGRWLRFYDPASPPSHLFLVRLDRDRGDRPLPHPDRKRDRIEWAWTQYLDQVDRLAWLDDDALPHLDVYTGTEIFAEAFGCRVHRPVEGMPFALPLIREASEIDRLPVPSPDLPCLRMLFDIADELRARAGPGALLRMVDLQSPMDIAALIWEKRGFYAALVEDPPAVRELARRVRGLLTAFLDEWRARYGEACIAHYPDYYLPRGISLSEDEIGAVSPRVFEELFLPELEELSGRYGGIGIHCCAHARHQWEGLKRIPGLMLLNLVQPESVLREAYGCFARRVPQMHAWCGEGDPAGWPARMPTGSRIVFQVNAGSRERAVEAARAMRASLDG